MKEVSNRVREVIEKSGYGVCRYLADKMGIPSGVVRKYFIYSSFVTFGSPIIFYLITAFWLNIRSYIRETRRYLMD